VTRYAAGVPHRPAGGGAGRHAVAGRRRRPAAVPQAQALVAGSGPSRCRIVIGSRSRWRAFCD